MQELRSKWLGSFDYPHSDGKPMAENDQHWDAIVALVLSLRDHFAGRDVYVGSDMFVCYDQHNRRRCVAPDVFVAFGVETGRPRLNFLTWAEGTVPTFIAEMSSRSTVGADATRKRRLYRRLGVTEYFLFDPVGTLMTPRVRALRLDGTRYRDVRPVEGRFPSEVLGLHLVRVGDELRAWDPATGQMVLTPAERAAAESQRATAESQRAAAEAERANSQAARADTAEAALRKLEAEMAELRRRLGERRDKS